MEPLSSCPAALLVSLLLLLLLLSEARGDCNPPQRTIGTQIRGESQPSYPVGTKLSYTCIPGYEPIPGTRPIIECLANSQWDKTPEFCLGRRCPFPNIENGRIVEDSDLRLGDEITFACDEGHRIIGRNRARCILRSGSVDWDSAPPHCERIPCYPPPTIPNGRHNGQDNYVYGTAVTYRCDEPFSLIGTRTLVCLSDKDQNGRWSSPAPRCEEVNCHLLTIENGVMITSIQPSYKYGDRIVFTCKEGYHLKGNKGDITCREDSTWGPRLPECILGSSGGDIGTGTTSGSGTPPTVIAGAVLGAIAVVAIIVGSLTYTFYRAQLKREGKPSTTAAPPESYTPVPSNADMQLKENPGEEKSMGV